MGLIAYLLSKAPALLSIISKQGKIPNLKLAVQFRDKECRSSGEDVDVTESDRGIPVLSVGHGFSRAAHRLQTSSFPN